jgi:hypothetical protein
MVEFDGFAVDCRVRGLVDVGQGRLTDMLNAGTALDLRDARLESLEDGHVVDAPTLTIAAEELCAVVAAGTRGDEARRLRTHTTRVQVDVGPYRIEGALHGTAAADPLGSVLRRPPWLPLTNAKLAYRRGSEEIAEDVETLIVNRDLASSIRGAPGETLSVRWEAAPTFRDAGLRAPGIDREVEPPRTG